MNPITLPSFPADHNLFAEDQKDPILLFGEGIKFKNDGFDKRAAEKFLAAANGGFVEAYFELGLILETNNFNDLGLRSNECYKKAGDLYFKQGNFKNALQNYEKALELEKIIGERTPNHPIALNDVGMCLYSLGKFQNAIVMHEKALSLFTSPEDFAKTWNYLGLSQHKSGSFSTALISFDNALNINPGDMTTEADILYNLAELKQDKGEFEDARNLSLKSLEIRKKLFDPPHIAIAESLTQLGCLYIHLNKNDDALSHNREALKMKLAIYGSASHPSLADSLHNVGSCLEALGHFEEALGYFKDALKMDQEVRGNDAEHPDIAIALGHIGNIARELGDFTGAREYYDRCLIMNQNINNDHGTAQALCFMGDLLIDLGLFKAALEFYKQALAKKKEVYSDNPTHSSIATSLNNLANTFMALDCLNEAFDFYQQSLQMEKEIYGENNQHASIAILLQHIGDIHRQQGSFKKALDHYQQCLDMQSKVLNTTNHPHIFVPLHKKGQTLAHLGRFNEALECLEQSLLIKKNFYKNSHYEVSIGLNSVGKVLEKLGRFDEALVKYEEALGIDEKAYEDVKTHHIELSLHNKSSCQGSLGRFEQALETEKRALKYTQEFYGETHSKSARSLRHIGVCLYSLGEHNNALKHHEEALEIYKKIYGDNHPEVADTWSHVANVYAALQNFTDAINTQNRAHDILKIFYNTEHPILANSLSHMASYLFSSNIQGAFDKYTECHAILEKKFGPNHPEVMLASTCIDICSQALKGKFVQETNEKTGRLSAEDFKILVKHATKHLENSDSIQVERNPSGFFRIRIDIPKEFHLANQIETIRLHYWPSTEEKIKIVEALHDHPRYFESMILNGGYIHNIYKKAEVPSAANHPLRFHRIVKIPNSQERTIFCLGTSNLEDVGQQETKKNMILHFPKSLVHQVKSFESNTLTINAVFKGEKDLTYFDIFMPEGNHLDPQRERDFLSAEESNKVIPEIHSILKKCNE